MAKVYLDPGHGGTDSGAVKYVKEKDVNLTMAKAARDYLESAGVNVSMSRTGDKYKSINERAAEANKWGADCVVSIHNNAGGGDGFEAICSVIGTDSRKLAKEIESQVKKIGQNSRGIKTRKNSQGKDYFGMIRLTKAPAVITEGAFVDNKEDVKIIDTIAEQKAFGVAIAKGILGYLGVEVKTQVEIKTQNEAAESYKVKVTVKALNIRTGAGTKYKVNGVIKDGGVYTIVKTSGNWGKLKSGAGWICLDYTKKV